MRLSLVICICLAFAMGLIMIFNTSSADILDRSLPKSTHAALIRQVLYALLGIVLSGGLWFLGYQNLLRLSLPLLCLFTLLLILVFVPGVGRMANGAHRWIWIGGYTFQPSEFVKFLIPLYFIQQYLQCGREGMPLNAFLKTMGVIALPLILILIEPDNRSALLIIITLFVLFFLTRIRMRYWAMPMALILLIGGTCAMHVPYVKQRLIVYLHPERDLQGKGHQPHQSKIAIGSGGIMGRGLGESRQKMTYLPEAQNDYIVAIYAEECGFIGILLLVGLYMTLVFIGFNIAYRATDKGACYVASIFTFLIGLQAFVNFGVVSSLLPSTGLNLPFFSQGGTSLWVNMLATTILLQIASTTRKVRRPVR